MSDLVRMSISIEKKLYDQLEKLVKESDYANRSEFVRDLIRARLVEQRWKGNEEAVGTITLVYDHHKRQLSEKLTHIQHHYHSEILAATHIHLDHDLCAESIMVRGKAKRIQELADRLRREKGVLHADLSMSAAGKELN